MEMAWMQEGVPEVQALPGPQPPEAQAEKAAPLLWIGQAAPHDIRPEAHPVIDDLGVEIGVRAAVAVANDGAMLVSEGEAFLQASEEHLKVAPAVRHGAHIEGRIKETNPVE